MEPKSAADRRPNDEPYYIDKRCEDCREKLVQVDVLDNPACPESLIWYDEFICPKCRGGVYMDWPESKFKEMEEARNEFKRGETIRWNP